MRHLEVCKLASDDETRITRGITWKDFLDTWSILPKSQANIVEKIEHLFRSAQQTAYSF
jgi:pterin-4a-carbinolamine dehydratase